MKKWLTEQHVLFNALGDAGLIRRPSNGVKLGFPRFMVLRFSGGQTKIFKRKIKIFLGCVETLTKVLLFQGCPSHKF